MFSGMKLGECWEINSSVPSLCCLPANHHGAAGQCTVGSLTSFPCWIMLKCGSVVRPQLSLQQVMLVCTLLVQQGLQISQCRICRHHNKCQVWTCHSCIGPALCLSRPLALIPSSPTGSPEASSDLAQGSMNLLFRDRLWDKNLQEIRNL